ncbi:MAG: hypothetical protein ACREOW_01370 [Thermodesulfobacteriota bacterium]
MTGGAIRFYKLSINDRKIAEALASLASDPITVTIALCLVGIVFWLIQLPSNSKYIIIGMAIILFTLVLICVILIKGKKIVQVSRIIDLKGESFISSGFRKFLMPLTALGILLYFLSPLFLLFPKFLRY